MPRTIVLPPIAAQMPRDGSALGDDDYDALAAYLFIWDGYIHARLRGSTVAPNERWDETIGTVARLGVEDPMVAAHVGYVTGPPIRSYVNIREWLRRALYNENATEGDMRAFAALVDNLIFRLVMIFVKTSAVMQAPSIGITVYRSMTIKPPDKSGNLSILDPGCSFVSTSMSAEFAFTWNSPWEGGVLCYMVIRVQTGVPAVYVPSLIGGNIAPFEYEVLLPFGQKWSFERAWRKSNGTVILIASVAPNHTQIFNPDSFHSKPAVWKSHYDKVMSKRDALHCGEEKIHIGTEPPEYEELWSSIEDVALGFITEM